MTGGVCPKCGTDNPPGATFCGSCGFQLGAAPGDPLPGPPPSYIQPGDQPLPPPPPAELPGYPGAPPSAPGDWQPGPTMPTQGSQGAWQPPPPPDQGAWQPPPAEGQGGYQPGYQGGYQGGGMQAPPAPPRKDNTLKIVLWIVGGCCGCALLIFLFTFIVGLLTAKSALKNGAGSSTSSHAGSGAPADTHDNSEATPGTTGTLSDLPKGTEHFAQISNGITEASAEEFQTWAKQQQLDPAVVDDCAVVAAANGESGILKYLAGPGNAEINEISPGYGTTPLAAAAYKGQTECMAVLLHAGADANYNMNGDQGTALHQAALGQQGAAADMLIEAGAQLEPTNDLGVTPLHDAANSDADAVAKALLDAGAPVDTVTEKEGFTALQLAATMGATKTGQVLIEHGANVNIVDPEFGKTALHLAAYKGHKDFVQLLLDNGANPYLRAKDGSTAADSAQAGGFDDIVQLLSGHASNG